MNRFIIILVTFSALASCASRDSFQSFYNSEKQHADFALSFPKYMAMVAIPKDSKKEVKYFTNGMKRIRVLFDEEKNDRLMKSFESFATDKQYIPYVVIKQDGDKINLFTREDEDFVREIVLDIETSDESVIIALMGKMDKKTFQRALKKASEQADDN